MQRYPEPFLQVRVTLLNDEYGTMALCAGFEGKKWRAEAFADHLFQWLPFASLDQESQNSFSIHNWVEFVRQASVHVYKTKKTQSRGEIGELILHIACVSEFATMPVLCKLILKTSSNDTVKGFDGVYVRFVEGDEFELWLGESKFYKDPKRAIKEAVISIRDHIAPEFLNTEKAMIVGHIAPDIPRRDELLKLFRSSTSSDDLLKKAVFPILICYNSDVIGSFEDVRPELVKALESEVATMRDDFKGQIDDMVLRFQMIFVPMALKSDLVEAFDKRLEAFL